MISLTGTKSVQVSKILFDQLKWLMISINWTYVLKECVVHRKRYFVAINTMNVWKPLLAFKGSYAY